MIPINISEEAIAEIKNIMTYKNIPKDYGLRLGLKGGGCSGMSFMLGFDKGKETDDSFEVEGVTVYVEKKHVMYLLSKKVVFYDDAAGRGFAFEDE